MTGTLPDFIPREIAKAEAQDEAAFAKLFEVHNAAIDAAAETLRQIGMTDHASGAVCAYARTEVLKLKLDTCRKCGADMRPGKAIGQTYIAGMPDFDETDEISTFSAGGSGQLIDCLKCSACGWSVTEGD